MRCEKLWRSVPAKVLKKDNKFYGSKIHGHKISAQKKYNILPMRIFLFSLHTTKLLVL